MDNVFINTADELNQYLSAVKQSKVIAVDTETTGLNPHTDRIRLVQLAAEGLPVLVIDCFTFLPKGVDVLSDILDGSNVKVFQNAKFDLQFFMALGIYPTPIFDTMLAGQLLRTSGGPSRVNLAALYRAAPNIIIFNVEQTNLVEYRPAPFVGLRADFKVFGELLGVVVEVPVVYPLVNAAVFNLIVEFPERHRDFVRF